MLTDQEIKEFFEYKNGSLYWKIQRCPQRKAGDRAGTTKPDGYRRIWLMGKNYYEHQLIWIYFNGSIESEIDHINGDASDNRIENLRKATRNEQMANRKININNSVGIKGLSYVKAIKKYMARIQKDGHLKYLGVFDTKEQAIAVIDSERQKMHADFARYA